ncbi:MAG: GDP-mannose 4,6-dehydratase [candidate division Zixibacteria bacterium]|nr:GDP-mannose 4,6-dehydratase [candidate division Zixibacteria bacterium]
MAKRYLVCGGCGFIGSNFVRLLTESEPEAQITVYDALTYAGALENLGGLQQHRFMEFVRGDIADPEAVAAVIGKGYDLVVNFAAETHVDRSLYYTQQFVRTNIWGVEVLLSACREREIPLLQISTDEVYGAAAEGESFDETAPLNPSSPYAASKAAADLLVLAAIKTFDQRAAIVRTTNNYGPRQFPEKLIPYFLNLIREGQPLPVYGDGQQRRCWLYVEDFCAGLLRLVRDFPAGEVVNIGADADYANLETIQLLQKIAGADSAIKHVADRPAHDRGYRIDSSKFERRYGTLKQRSLESGLAATVAWYRENPAIFARLRKLDAAGFESRHYQAR